MMDHVIAETVDSSVQGMKTGVGDREAAVAATASGEKRNSFEEDAGSGGRESSSQQRRLGLLEDGI